MRRHIQLTVPYLRQDAFTATLIISALSFLTELEILRLRGTVKENCTSMTSSVWRSRLLLLLSLFFLLNSVHSQSNQPVYNNLIVDAQSKSLKTAQYIEFFKDTENQLDSSQILELPDEKWTLSQSSSLNFGTSSSTFWFRLRLANASGSPLSLIALDNYAPTDHVEFFLIDKENQIQLQFITGDRHPYSSRPIEHLSYAFPFSLEPTQNATILVKVRSGGNIIVPISIWSQLEFFKYQNNFFIIFGLLIGTLLVTSFYNLFVYIQTKDRLFLSFSFFIISITFLVSHQSGLAMSYLWPNATILNEFGALLSVSFAVSGHLSFTLYYLSIKGKLRKFCLTLVSLCLLVLPAYLFLPYGLLIQFNLACAMILLISTLAYSVSLSFKQDSAAKAYTLAWTPFIIGTFTSGLIRFNIIPYSVYTEFAGLFFATITIIWLSAAIAGRINSEKLSRISAQHLAISNLKKYEELFEHSVEGIFTSTVEGKLLRANPAFIKMLNYQSKDALFDSLGENLRDLYKYHYQREQIITELLLKGEIVDKEVELIKSNGDTFWASMSIRISNNNDELGTVFEGAMFDISMRKKSESQLAFLAAHDPLTNLYNRREFESQLKEALSEIHQLNSMISVLYMDLDQFKVVNDTCGHTVGDKLLRELTHLMTTTLNGRGLLARLGGDEFGLILRDCDQDTAYQIAEEIRSMVENYRFSHEDRAFRLGISTGLVELTSGFSSVEDVMSYADTACYAAKDAGRNQIHVYSSSNIEFEKRRQEMDLVTAINSAISQDRFQLFRQKIVFNNDHSKLHGYEILLRMIMPNNELCLPYKFISAAERYGLMFRVDQWVIENTLRWLQQNPNELENIECYSINLSGQSLGSKNLKKLTNHLLECFTKYDIPYNKVCFEITETCAIQDIARTIQFIDMFREYGCHFSLDDFGSGLSSYGYLKTLPVDYLKIDGSFVKGIAHDPVDYAMVESIHTVARAMGKKTIAEFVENQDIIDSLRSIGVDYSQGYGIDKPHPIPNANPVADTNDLNIKNLGSL